MFVAVFVFFVKTLNTFEKEEQHLKQMKFTN